jgi:YidC/Oxa1 family membrane protein insertase
MSPEFMRGMSYFLPTISLIFTSFLPSAIQLSFFITGALSYCQAQLFRWAPFRTYMKMTPLPTGRPDAFARAPAVEPSPYQSRIITATARPASSVGSTSYEPPRSTSSGASPSTPPAKTSLLSGLKREVSSGISSVQESARKTLKSAREIAGQESKDGKRTKKQLQQANEYEKKRRMEEGRKREEAERERRARREANRGR